ncbi:MAG: hypothetical protein AB8F65_04980 [Woeseiaceae bacterium]
MMKRSKRAFAAVAASLAMIGSLHAPLHAEETVIKTELVRHESAAADLVKDQRAIIEASAESALRAAERAMKADLNIDLEQTIGRNKTLTIAGNSATVVK